MQIIRDEHGLTTIPLAGEGLSIVHFALKDWKEKEKKRQQALEQPFLEQSSVDNKKE